jgi:hypothetical protein
MNTDNHNDSVKSVCIRVNPWLMLFFYRYTADFCITKFMITGIYNEIIF